MVASRGCEFCPRFPSGYARAAARVLVPALALLLFSACERRAASHNELVRRLERSLDGRPVAFRLSGTTSHKPCRPSQGEADEDRRGLLCEPFPTRSGPRLGRTLRSLDELKRARAGGDDALATPDSVFLALVFRRSRGRLEEVLERIDDEATARPTSEGLSDLAAVHATLAVERDRPQHLFLALEAIERSVAADPASGIALYNRAVLLEAVALRAEAQGAWHDFLRRESAGPWAEEGRERLHTLGSGDEEGDDWAASAAREKVRSWPTRARDLLEELVVERWSARVLDDDPAGARAELGEARALAAADHAVWNHGEGLALLEAIERAEREGAVETRRLAEAKSRFVEGRRLHDRQAYSQADALLRQAERDLQRHASPLALRAGFLRAVGAFHQPDYSTATRELERIEAAAERQQMDRLQAQCLWMLGLIQWAQGEIGDSIGSYSRALSGFESVGDLEGRAAMHNLRARAWQYLGESDGFWADLTRALELLTRIDSPRRTSNIMTTATLGCRELGALAAARVFQDRQVEAALDAGNPLLAAIALRRAAVLEAELGRPSEAERLLGESRSWISRIPDVGLRERQRYHDLVARARVLEDRDPDRALASLEQALGFIAPVGERLRWAEIQIARGENLRRLGRLEDARSAYTAALAEVEARMAARSLRDLSLLEQRTEVYESMMALDRRAGDAGLARVAGESEELRSGALAFVARALGRGAAGPAGPPPPVSGPSPPAGVRILRYVVLEEGLLVSLRSERADRQEIVATTASELASLTRGLVSALRNGGEREEWGSFAGELYLRLVAPVERELEGAERLVFVLDGSLSLPPIAALLSPGTGRLLIEDYDVVIAPSEAWYLASLGSSENRCRRLERFLLLASPRPGPLDRGDLARLSDLRALESAASRWFGSVRTLRDEAATVAAFRSAAAGSQVVHYGGHTRINSRDPLLSRLVLSPDPSLPSDSGALMIRDLRDLRLDESCLVVLASCSSAGGASIDRSALGGFASPFLAAGVPQVVASLWEIEDRATEDFFVDFYRALEATGDAPKALRRVQLARTKGGDGGRGGQIWPAFLAFQGALPAAETRSAGGARRAKGRIATRRQWENLDRRPSNDELDGR